MGPFSGGLNVAKKAEIARFALQIDSYFGQADDHLQAALEFDRMPYASSPVFEGLADAVTEARLISFQEEVVAILDTLSRLCLKFQFLKAQSSVVFVFFCVAST